MGGARKEKLGKKTTSGIQIIAGRIENELDITDYADLLEDITKIRMSDCVASATLDILKLPILRADIDITCSENKISKLAKQYITYTFDNLQIDKYREGGLKYFLEHLLTALDYGFAMFEPVWRIEQYGGYMTKRLLYMSPIRPETITEWLFDEEMEWVGIKQNRIGLDNRYSTVEIKSSDLFIFTFGEEFYDVRGKSLLRKSRLAWKYKERVLNSVARSIARGAGIPKIKLSELADDATFEKAQVIGRTIGNSDNAFVISQDGVMDIELMSLQNQGSAMELLQYLDRQMLFNTLTQFMTAGIGENGSRASTGELKTPYELRVNDMATKIEDCLNRLIIQIIRNSFLFGVLGNMDYPKAKLFMPVNTALDEIATSIQKLASVRAINFTIDDEKYLRTIFNLPQNSQNQKTQLELTHKQKELKIPANFEFEAIKEFYIRQQDIVDREIEMIYKEMLNNIIFYIKQNKEVRRVNLENCINRLEKIYYETKIKGRIDLQAELMKISKNIALENKEENIKQKKKIKRLVKTLYYDLEQTAENLIENATKKQLANGIENFLIMKIGDGFKMLRRQISASVMDGYTEGRNEVIAQADENILYTYTVCLEDIENVCEECMPLDGIEMTKQEAIEHGLRIEETGRLNPDCLGGDNCRCLLVPTSQRRI